MLSVKVIFILIAAFSINLVLNLTIHLIGSLVTLAAF